MNIAELCELLDSIDPDAGGYDDYLRTRVLNEFPALAGAYIEAIEALERILEYAFDGPAYDEAVAAIAKARGEARVAQ